MQSDLTSTTAIVTHGDIASLVAIASTCSHADRGSPVLLASPPNKCESAQWRKCVDKHAEQYNASAIIDLPLARGGAAHEFADIQSILAAVGEAAKRNIERVIWARQCDMNLDMIGRVSEITILVRQLAQIAGENPPVIETPLLELTNKQMIELGAHLNVAWDAAWSCELPAEIHCGACNGCRQRRKLFNRAGVSDPIFNTSLQTA